MSRCQVIQHFNRVEFVYPINQFIIGFLRLLKKILSLLNCTLLRKRSLALEFLESTVLKIKYCSKLEVNLRVLLYLTWSSLSQGVTAFSYAPF